MKKFIPLLCIILMIISHHGIASTEMISRVGSFQAFFLCNSDKVLNDYNGISIDQKKIQFIINIVNQCKAQTMAASFIEKMQDEVDHNGAIAMGVLTHIRNHYDYALYFKKFQTPIEKKNALIHGINVSKPIPIALPVTEPPSPINQASKTDYNQLNASAFPDSPISHSSSQSSYMPLNVSAFPDSPMSRNGSSQSNYMPLNVSAFPDSPVSSSVKSPSSNHKASTINIASPTVSAPSSQNPSPVPTLSNQSSYDYSQLPINSPTPKSNLKVNIDEANRALEMNSPPIIDDVPLDNDMDFAPLDGDISSFNTPPPFHDPIPKHNSHPKKINIHGGKDVNHPGNASKFKPVNPLSYGNNYGSPKRFDFKNQSIAPIDVKNPSPNSLIQKNP
jgi:hypothetical protein